MESRKLVSDGINIVKNRAHCADIQDTPKY